MSEASTEKAAPPTGAEHTNNSNKGKKMLPDIITMTAGGLADGDSCTIKVWVMTEKEHKKTFAPTDCPVTLNNGVKVFDASMNLLLQDDSSLIFDDGAAQTDGTDNDGFCREAAPDVD
jgi:hypothetical protein